MHAGPDGVGRAVNPGYSGFRGRNTVMIVYSPGSDTGVIGSVRSLRQLSRADLAVIVPTFHGHPNVSATERIVE